MDSASGGASPLDGSETASSYVDSWLSSSDGGLSSASIDLDAPRKRKRTKTAIATALKHVRDVETILLLVGDELPATALAERYEQRRCAYEMWASDNEPKLARLNVEQCEARKRTLDDAELHALVKRHISCASAYIIAAYDATVQDVAWVRLLGRSAPKNSQQHAPDTVVAQPRIHVVYTYLAVLTHNVISDMPYGYLINNLVVRLLPIIYNRLLACTSKDAQARLVTTYETFTKWAQRMSQEGVYTNVALAKYDHLVRVLDDARMLPLTQFMGPWYTEGLDNVDPRLFKQNANDMIQDVFSEWAALCPQQPNPFAPLWRLFSSESKRASCMGGLQHMAQQHDDMVKMFSTDLHDVLAVRMTRPRKRKAAATTADERVDDVPAAKRVRHDIIYSEMIEKHAQTREAFYTALRRACDTPGPEVCDAYKVLQCAPETHDFEALERAVYLLRDAHDKRRCMLMQTYEAHCKSHEALYKHTTAQFKWLYEHVADAQTPQQLCDARAMLEHLD